MGFKASVEYALNFKKYMEISLRRNLINSICAIILFLSCGLLSSAQSLPDKACKRIISLAPSITEMLFALELGSSVVAVTNYCKFPTEASQLPHIGGLFDTNLEAGLMLKPDLVVGLQESKTILTSFKHLGVTTLKVSDRSVSDIYESLLAICNYCGCEEKSEELVRDLRKEIEPYIQARNMRAAVPVALVVASSISAGSEELYLSGYDGYYSSIFTILNAKNVFSNTTAAIPTSSFETLVALAPRMIFVVEADPEKFEDLKKRINEYLPKVKVVRLGGDYSVVPGPRFPLLVRDIAQGLGLFNG